MGRGSDSLRQIAATNAVPQSTVDMSRLSNPRSLSRQRKEERKKNSIFAVHTVSTPHRTSACFPKMHYRSVLLQPPHEHASLLWQRGFIAVELVLLALRYRGDHGERLSRPIAPEIWPKHLKIGSLTSIVRKGEIQLTE